MKLFKNPFFYTSLLSLMALGLIIGSYVFGWTTPSTTPPGGNITLQSSQWTTSVSDIYYNLGNVGIGTTGPGAKLDVDGNITQSVTHGNNMKLWLSAARNGGATGEVGLYSWISEPGMTWTGGGIARNMYNTTSFPRINTGLSGQMMRFAEGNNIEFTIETAAGARTTPFTIIPEGVNALAFYYSSDESLKKNIQEIETPLAKIMKLDGISFDWKESGKKSIGLIAQDVEKVFPEIVETDEETGLKSIEYGKLVAPLIEAVKEQQKMIDEQKELINQQGEEIKALKVSLGQF